MKHIKTTAQIIDVLALCVALRELNKEFILFLDIDDTTLSSLVGHKFVDKQICDVVDYVYKYNPMRLVFCTARDHELIWYTKNQLNRAKLTHQGKYIHYNVVCSPYDMFGNPTKGRTIMSELADVDKDVVVIFADDQRDQIDNVYAELYRTGREFALFHYTKAEDDLVEAMIGNRNNSI